MTKKQSPVPDDEEQAKRFIETARQLGVDESGNAFEDAMKVVPLAPAPKPQNSNQAPEGA